jgi:hypothetical protein
LHSNVVSVKKKQAKPIYDLRKKHTKQIIGPKLPKIKENYLFICQPYSEADRACTAKNYQQLPTIKKYASYVKKENCL